MYQAVINFLDSKNWKYQEVEGKEIVHFGISANNGNIDCVADIRAEKKQFIFLSYCAVQAFQNKIEEVGEFINRVNYGLIIGDFEVNYESGKIRFKTSMYYDDTFPPSPSLIENTLITNLFMMDRYLPGFMGVLYGSISPVAAIKEIEGPDSLNYN